MVSGVTVTTESENQALRGFWLNEFGGCFFNHAKDSFVKGAIKLWKRLNKS